MLALLWRQAGWFDSILTNTKQSGAVRMGPALKSLRHHRHAGIHHSTTTNTQALITVQLTLDSPLLAAALRLPCPSSGAFWQGGPC